jgi:fatty-acid desaturase
VDRVDIEPVRHETRDRTITGMVTVVPVLALVMAAWWSWDRLLRPGDLIVFALLYVLTGLGVTVGFHRHFTHRSFKTRPEVRAILAVLGSAAIEGPVISWVADHRKHHAFSDRPGDPHSPHVDHGVGWTGALRGLGHTHIQGRHGLATRRPASTPSRDEYENRHVDQDQAHHEVERRVEVRLGRERDRASEHDDGDDHHERREDHTGGVVHRGLPPSGPARSTVCLRPPPPPAYCVIPIR